MDLFKIIGDSKDSFDKNFTIKSTPKSISSFAAKSTYYFPVLCSRNVNPDVAGMISRSLERSYASFIRACFAMMPAMVVNGSVVNVDEYLRMFHQNIGIDSEGELVISLQNEAVDAPYEMFTNDILNEATGSNVGKIIRDGYNNNTSKSEYNKQQYKTQYSDNDYKKANEMVPSIVEVKAEFIVKGSDKTVSIDLPVGVKTKLHSVDPVELDSLIMDAIAGKGVLNALIRWSTGEVLSIKDILFGTTKMKKNISNRNSDVNKWADALDHRKRLSGLSTPLLGKRAFLPNVTMVISMDEVQEIKRQVGYDLVNDPKQVVRFMKENFLLGFVIIDDLTETLWVMYDGHRDFEEYPYASVRRDNDKYDKDMSLLIKTLSKTV